MGRIAAIRSTKCEKHIWDLLVSKFHYSKLLMRIFFSAGLIQIHIQHVYKPLKNGFDYILFKKMKMIHAFKSFGTRMQTKRRNLQYKENDEEGKDRTCDRKMRFLLSQPRSVLLHTVIE